MNRLQRKFALLRTINRHEKQIAILGELKDYYRDIGKDKDETICGLIELHWDDLEKARAELKSLDSPVEIETGFPNFILMDLV